MATVEASGWAWFDVGDHALNAGWATYHRRRPRKLRSFGCLLRGMFRSDGGHVLPDFVPEPPNGFSPSNTTRCRRCGAWMHWYAPGQHRWGGMNRDVARAGFSRD